MRRFALVTCLATLPTIGFALSPLVDIAALIQDREAQAVQMVVDYLRTRR